MPLTEVLCGEGEETAHAPCDRGRDVELGDHRLADLAAAHDISHHRDAEAEDTDDAREGNHRGGRRLVDVVVLDPKGGHGDALRRVGKLRELLKPVELGERHGFSACLLID